ncbi:hypothetical protein F4777DRAFT_535283 [Nemania sp. FL0916]|nr:hypothetical protein F4777DRAFT_535283 [Nemania sp. FL0916]
MAPHDDSHARREHQLLEPTRDDPTSSSPGTPHVRLQHVNPSSGVERETEVATDTVDIFAIHGLDTKSPDTWIWKDNPRDPKSPGVNWLADKSMLPSRLERCRIFMCDWPAELFESTKFAERTFEELARLLLDSILAHHRQGQPIVFIASCLGGVILMKTLDMATDKYLPIKTDTRGIIFLTTPFQGTAFEKVAKWAEPGLRAWAAGRGRRVTKRLDLAKQPNLELLELVRRFTEFRRGGNCEISIFYEKGLTDLYRRVSVMPSGFNSAKEPLVDEMSGTLQCVPHPLSLNRNHVQMNKFPSPDDQDYNRVAHSIEQCVWNIRKATPLQEADACILKRYSDGRLDIVRLSGLTLNMDQCYINLAIIEQRAGSSDNAASRASPPTLSSRLGIEHPKAELLVNLATLFDPRNLTHETVGLGKPRRILIHGRAGVGKTTLCKKIVHDFINGKIWKTLFVRVLWIPLRELKKEGYTKHNIGEVFGRIYFSNRPDGDELAAALWKPQMSKSLFLLDGLDEVSELLDSRHEKFDLLVELLNCPNVIITSRPHMQLSNGVNKPHLELETVGFHPEQVKTYVKTVAHGSETSKEILSLLEKSEHIRSLVRIPIILDALCFSWDGSFSNGSTPDTMTDIYKAITQQLWRKDIVRSNKLSKQSAKKASWSEVEKRMENEIQSLEFLAFSGMYNNIIEFQSEHREGVRELIAFNTQGVVFDEMLENLSFLRSSDSSENIAWRTCHFLHLTFQEFFAAKHLVRQWKAGHNIEYLDLTTNELLKITPKAFLRQEKYTERYDIVWRFAIGLLQSCEVSDFFEVIGQEPVDLVGPAHHRLLMNCLSEAASAEAGLRSNIEARLSQWLSLELFWWRYELLLNPPLSSKAQEFPEGALISAWKKSSFQEQESILESITRRQVSEEFTRVLVESMNQWTAGSSLTLDAITLVLTNQNHLSEAICVKLMMMIADEALSENIRENAVIIIESQRNYSDAILGALVGKCSGEFNRITAAEKVEDLAKTSPLPKPVITIIVKLFTEKRTKPYARRIAAEFWGGDRSLSEEAIKACLWVIENCSLFGQDAEHALCMQKSLSEATIARLLEFSKSELDYDGVEYCAIVVLLFYRNRRSSEEIWSRLTEFLGENSKDMFWGREFLLWMVIRALSREDHLPNGISTALLSLFENKRRGRNLLVASARALGIHTLSEKNITTLIELIEEYLQGVAFPACLDMLESSDKIVGLNLKAMVIDFPENEIVKVELDKILADLLNFRGELSDDTILILATIVENEQNSSQLRSEAAEIISRQQRSFSERAIAPLARMIERCIDTLLHRNGFGLFRKNLCDIIYRQNNLSEKFTMALIKIIENAQAPLSARDNAACELAKRTDLPQTTITAVKSILKTYPDISYWNYIGLLANQRDLPDAAVEDLLLFDGDDSHKYDIAMALGSEPCLLDRVINTMKSTSERERSGRHLELLKFSYQSFFEHAMREHFVMYIDEGHLVICLPNGSREKIMASREEVMALIHAERRRFAPNFSDAWPGLPSDALLRSLFGLLNTRGYRSESWRGWFTT